MAQLLRANRWQVAFRTKPEEPFRLVQNPVWAWAADPFLVKYEGDVYLFAELFLYRSERNGVIGYCKYENNNFGEWTVSMDKHWHLSYPNVFVHDGRLFMCPESYQREEVAVYELTAFPDKWKKVATLLENGMYVDTTFFQHDDQKYMFTFEQKHVGCEGRLWLYPLENGKPGKPYYVTDDIGCARPAGNIIYDNGKKYRVSQDCTQGYGCGLVVQEIDAVLPAYREHEIKRIGSDQIRGRWNRKFTGIHTYNRLGNLEVIDLKYSVYSMREYLARKRVRRVFWNKYR